MATTPRRGLPETGLPEQAPPEPSRLGLLASVTGAAIETAWIAAHLALYPTGLIRRPADGEQRYGMRGLMPAQRGLLVGDVEAAGTPILLVHGMADNRAIFTLLTRGLRRRGFHRVISSNYPITTNDIRVAAGLLHDEVEAVVEATGYERVHVIGHSLGGLIARYYLQRLGGDQRVHTLVTLGTPHSGSLLAYLLPVRLGRQLRPGSELFTELAQPAVGCRTRIVAYWSDLDQLVLPRTNGQVQHPDLLAQNIRVRGVGHMSLPIHGRLVHDISTLLGKLNTDGSPRARQH